MTPPPTISVIIAIYNHFEWLRLILDALRMQSDKDFEVIIADDGSNEETVKQIEDYCVCHPEMPVIHSRQPDEGWRKNKSLNKAVRLSKGEYLIFIDGDCIPHPDFIADHRGLRKRGRVFSGRRVDMAKPLSEMVESWEELPPDYFRRVRREILNNVGGNGLGATWSQLKRTFHFPFLNGKALGLKDSGILGCNIGIYKSDLERVNGFDERYLFPGIGEDTDLELRLRNAGIRCAKSSRYALMLHRCHPRLPLDSPENNAILQQSIRNKTTWVEDGIISKEDVDSRKNRGEEQSL